MSHPKDSSDKYERPERLSGPTYKLPMANGDHCYMTVNSDTNGRVVEIFVRVDNPHIYGLVSLINVLTSRLLQRGEDINTIIDAMSLIFEPNESPIPFHGRPFYSLPAVMAEALRLHNERDEIAEAA